MTLLMAPLPAAAQGGDSDESAVDDAALIQILDVADDGETVVIDVAVPSRGDSPLPDKSVFGLAYNGDSVEDFQLSGVTGVVDVIMVLDTSGSMIPSGAMTEAKRAANALVDRLPANARVGVIGFGDTVTVLNEPTADHSVARSNINNLAAGGDTALWDGLVEASKMGSSTSGTLPYIVVLSDGANDGGVATQQDAIDALAEAGSALYAVFIDSPSADGTELQAVVESVNGIYVAADSGNLQTTYERIADRLAGRYQLTFARPNPRTARVTVSVVIDDTLAFAQVVLDGVQEAAVTEPETPARVLNVPVESQLGAVPPPNPGVLGQPLMLPLGALAMFLAMILMGALIVNPAVDVRLEAATRADQVAGFKGRLSTAADQLVARRDQEGELNKALDAAGLHLRPGEFVLITAVIVVVLSLLGWLIGGLLLGTVVAGLASAGCLMYLNRRAEKQRGLFADQLTDTLGVMGGSLRAGRGLPQAIELVSKEAPSPTAEQFRRIAFEVQVGRDLTQSMMSVAERMKSQDFEWVARAVAINRELGGDLTELLDTIANTIRERRRISRMVKAISAEGRASGWVLLVLPFFVFAFSLWRTPDTANLMFTTSLGRVLVIIALTMMTIGYFWIRKIVNFKY
ncbi:MAG: type II secretion system F family protein [Acidimicrobiia bacterium]|nr:type II secretion system F family protein [Acidimicrobiia bacterium]